MNTGSYFRERTALSVCSFRIFIVLLIFSAFTNVSVADVLAARKDLTIIRKVSSVPPATRGLVKADNYGQLTKVKIGKVPDRGGRPSEQAPPPPEMPSWQQRSGPQHGQQRGGGQGGLHFFGGGQGGSGGRGGGYQQGGNRGGYNQPGKTLSKSLEKLSQPLFHSFQYILLHHYTHFRWVPWRWRLSRWRGS